MYYPITPPSIIFNDGKKIKNIFDENGTILVETIKKENWNKSIWLSTLIFYIELLISRETGEEQNSPEDQNKNQNAQNNIINKNEKYGKRKWKDYVEEMNGNGQTEAEELEKNIKKKKD